MPVFKPSLKPSSIKTETQASGHMLAFIVGCALFMQMLDATVVATALPAMARAMGTTPVQLNVAITSYLLAAAVFVPVSGWAADRFGAKKVFITAIAIFTLSSMTCALAGSLIQLVVSRVMQGLGGAMMVPVGRIILLRSTPKHKLLNLMAFLSMPALLGPMIGPPLGGFLVTYASWHWIFLINIPIGIAGIFMILRYVVELPPDGLTHKLDGLGFLLSSICLACLVGGFEMLGNQRASFQWIIILVSTGLLSGWAYIWHARRHPTPILDLSLMRIPTFRVAMLGGNLCRFTVGATPFLLALLLQVGFGLTPLSAGFITFTSAIGALLMKFVAAPILRRWGYRRVLMVNAVLTGAALTICASFTPNTANGVMIGILLLGGFFRSLQFTATNTLAYADVSQVGMSRASSFAAMGQQLGVSLGVGVAAASIKISMLVRGDETMAARDIVSGFIVVGVMCMLASLSFKRLPMSAGQSLHTSGNKPGPVADPPATTKL